LTARSDWQNLMAQFRASGYQSLRLYVNWIGLAGAPFKIMVASIIGSIFGFAGGLISALSSRWLPNERCG
ncbi:MAG TPA: hypothetical protein VJ865_05440, partial [Gemmatimonadaceae bacterium]|nr:hypothetical protein [Gemmatimonadaceae bacterium]